MNAPSADISQVIESVDIVQEISKYVQLKQKGNEFSACCPFHNEDTPSFYVNPLKRLFYCFGCQTGGNVINFRANIAGLQFKDALTALAREHGIKIESHAKPTAPLRETLDTALSMYRSMLLEQPSAQAYLKERHLSQEVIQQFEIGFANDEWQMLSGSRKIKQAHAESLGMIIPKNGRYYDRFRARVMFPIRDHFGALCGFGGRCLGDEKPKYLNSPESSLYHKSKILYGLNHAIKAKSKHMIVSEGYLDVIALHQAGFTGGVAPLGTAFTTEQFHLLCQYADEITFCFDGDAAGIKAANKAFETVLPHLRDQVACFFLFLDKDEDPDSIIQKGGAALFEQKMQKRLGLSCYMDQICSQGLDISRLEHKAIFLKKVAEVLKLMPSSITKRLIQKKHQFNTAVKIEKTAVPAVKTSLEMRLIELLFSCPGVVANNQMVFESYKRYLPPLSQSALETLTTAPHASLAEFIETTGVDYRPSQLALQSDENAVCQELSDLLYRMKLNRLTQAIKTLTDRGRSAPLSEVDNQKLQSLFKTKHEMQKSQINAS